MLKDWTHIWDVEVAFSRSNDQTVHLVEFPGALNDISQHYMRWDEGQSIRKSSKVTFEVNRELKVFVVIKYILNSFKLFNLFTTF